MSANSDVTTIKVTRKLRDRISAGAAEQHQTVQRFIESALENYDRNRRLAAVAAAMADADEETLQHWRAETESWDAADGDIEATG